MGVGAVQVASPVLWLVLGGLRCQSLLRAVFSDAGQLESQSEEGTTSWRV